MPLARSGSQGTAISPQLQAREVATTSAGRAGGRAILRARAGWRDAPQVGYYGVGMNTLDEDRVNFRLQQAYAGGSAIWLVTKRVVVAGSSDFETSP